MTNKQLAIALAADRNYSEQVITLIKSICYHKHRAKIYLLHKDFPSEWFSNLNTHLKQIDCEIISVVVVANIEYKIHIPHINKTSFYRFFVQELPESRILYLDSDILINGDLAHFYHQDFEGYPLIAVEDFFLNNVEHFYKEFPNLKPYFNSGVLLVNNSEWKKQNIKHVLLDLSYKCNKAIYGDQDILNMVFHSNWKSTDVIYNYQAGAKSEFHLRNLFDLAEQYEKLDVEPTIIHYTSSRKPWLAGIDIQYRDKYWFYYQLEWSEIIQKYQLN